MGEQRTAALRCWDACLEYELARAEVWCEMISGASGASDWLQTTPTPSITDKTVVLMLCHVACDYLTATPEHIADVLRTFKRLKAEACGDVGFGRLSLPSFTALLDSTALVENAGDVLSTFWKNMLQIDRTIVQCVSDEVDVRAALESEEQAAREQLLSSNYSWERTRLLQGRLQQQRAQLETWRPIDDEAVDGRGKILRIRHVQQLKEEQPKRRAATETSRAARVSLLSDTLGALHDQLRVEQEHSAQTLPLLMGEMREKISHVVLKDFRGLPQWGERLSKMERQLGIVGRFAVGLSLLTVGRREHDMILQRMRDTATSSSTNTATTTTTPTHVVAAGDLSWLIEENEDGLNDYCASSTTMVTGATEVCTASPLQQCLFDVSYYRAKEGPVSTRVWEIPSFDERRNIEGFLRQTFDSLTHINYMAIPFLQKDAKTLDTVVLFPSFELFVTQCEMNVIGSPRLAFFKYCSQRLDVDIVAYVKSLVREAGSWIVEYAMGYEDFLTFLVNQAAVEYVRHAYLLTPKRLLMNIVTDFILPRWLRKLKTGKRVAGTWDDDVERVESVNSFLPERQDCNDLCLLLDTSITWLGIAGRSLQDFAQAYRTHAVDYAFATMPEHDGGGITTTQAILALLFPTGGAPTRLRCSVSRLEALRRSYGSIFAVMSERVGRDGSLESVAAWMSLGIAGVSRDGLVRRITDVADRIVRSSFDEDVCSDGRHGLTLGFSCAAPFSWILALAVCARLSFDRSLVTSGLDALFSVLTAPS